MTTTVISTKQIRTDLEGFLQRLKAGQVLQVMYRSKPLVTVAAKQEIDAYLAQDAGTPAAAKRSAAFVKNLPVRKQVFDSHKSFKELYRETQTL